MTFASQIAGRTFRFSTAETRIMLHIIGWIIAGLIVGALARLLVPGRQNMGILLTIVLGIAGALVGGLVSHLLFGPSFTVDSSGYAVQTAWPGWIMAILGGMVVLGIGIAINNRSG